MQTVTKWSFIVVLLAPTFVRANDAAEAKAIIEKAIKARGDKPNAKSIAQTWTDKGIYHGYGRPLPYTAAWTFQEPDKYRFEFVIPHGTLKNGLTVVVNGDKAWGKEGKDKTYAFEAEEAEQIINEAHQHRVTALAPLLTDKGFILATAKGQDVDKKPTVAVKVMHDKKPTVAVKVMHDKKPTITLYFDKETGLLLKRELMVKDPYQKGKEVLEESYFGAYKDVGGSKHFTSLKIVRDGELLSESTLSDMRDVEKLDPKLFEKP